MRYWHERPPGAHDRQGGRKNAEWLTRCSYFHSASERSPGYVVRRASSVRCYVNIWLYKTPSKLDFVHYLLVTSRMS
jgi:hypothetical protein